MDIKQVLRNQMSLFVYLSYWWVFLVAVGKGNAKCSTSPASIKEQINCLLVPTPLPLRRDVLPAYNRTVRASIWVSLASQGSYSPSSKAPENSIMGGTLHNFTD